MKYFIFLILLSICFYLGYVTHNPERVHTHTETVVTDTLIVNHTDTIKIVSKGKSYVRIDTLVQIDTVFADTAYIVQFDTSTARLKVSGETAFRFGNRSTYKLNLWLYPDTVVYKVKFLQDSLKALLSLNNQVLLDSVVFIPRIERELEWYEKEWLWFGVGAFTTAGIVYLIK